MATHVPGGSRVPRSPAIPTLIGGPAPVPTEGIASLAVLNRGMKVWAFDGRWEQGTLVGRSSAAWLVVLMSEGFHHGRELSLPVEKRGLAPTGWQKLRDIRLVGGACPPFSTNCFACA